MVNIHRHAQGQRPRHPHLGAHDLIIASRARATNRTVATADPSAFDELRAVTAVAHR